MNPGPLPATDTLLPAPGWAALLAHFYARAQLPMIRLQRMTGSEVPQPYRSLLVHSLDMTPTLEKFFRQPLELRALARELQDAAYLREVTLNLKERAKPVAYGVIRIFHDHFPASARRLILAEKEPLGGILRSESIAHIGWPQAFFRAESDARMALVLGLRRPGWLYGRRNLLLDGSRQVLADVIEVLAPVDLPTRVSE